MENMNLTEVSMSNLLNSYITQSYIDNKDLFSNISNFLKLAK